MVGIEACHWSTIYDCGEFGEHGKEEAPLTTYKVVDIVVMSERHFNSVPINFDRIKIGIGYIKPIQ
jgi:hypothetical protein